MLVASGNNLLDCLVEFWFVCLRFVVRVASHTVAHIAVFSFRVAFDSAHGMAVKVHDRLSGSNDASAMGLLAATLHTVAHIAVFRFHVAFDRTVAHMGWR